MLSERDRLRAIGIIWGVFGLLAALTLLRNDAGGSFLLIAVLATAAWLSTDSIMDAARKAAQGEGTGKAKRDLTAEAARETAQVETLLALLDEDDIHEVRARLKTRLLANLERGSDGELSALDALLAEEQLRSRR